MFLKGNYDPIPPSYEFFSNLYPFYTVFFLIFSMNHVKKILDILIILENIIVL